jgi:pimeloyl-ACP methyl ester carboxylesterase
MSQTIDSSVAQGQFVSVNGMNVFYEEYGSGTPLILLTGAMGTGASWKAQVPLYSAHFRVIAPDPRGCGRTDNPGDQILRTPLLADDVVAFVHALNLEKPFLCGWSTGGDVALDVGIRYPDLARGLVLGAVAYRVSEIYFKELIEMGIEGPGQVNIDLIEKAAPQMVERWRSEHRQSADQWKMLLKQTSYDMMEPPTHPDKDLQKIRVPALVITGDRDQYLRLEDMVELYRLIPNAELAVVAQADHFVGRTKPDVFANCVLEFLRRHNGPAEI